MNTTTVETDSPELRGTILAHVLHHIVMTPGSVTYGAVFGSAMKAVGKPEEECGLEVMAAAHLLVRSGLLVSNTYEVDGLSITADTVLTAAPHVTGWIWRDVAGEPDDGTRAEA